MIWSSAQIQTIRKAKLCAWHSTAWTGTSHQLAPIKLNGDDLPWVSKAKHIGNILHEDGSTEHDIKVKKGIFIQTAMDLNQEFFSLPPNLKLKLCELYNSHFSGSSFWKLESMEAKHLYSAWDKNIKVMYDLPWATHRWILEEITGKNLKLMLLRRFLKFVNAILKTSKPFLKFLLRTVSKDVRSVTGSNLRSIMVNNGVHAVPGVTQASAIRLRGLQEVPAGEEWKVPLLHSLLDIRAGEFQLSFDEHDDHDDVIADDLLVHVCTSWVALKSVLQHDRLLSSSTNHLHF